MSKYGLSFYNDRADAEVDILFVHGLRGHRKETWSKNGFFWPGELLAKDIEKCRIISFGYDSGVVHSDTAEVTQGSVESDAKDLCALLTSERAEDGTEDRPIITVAHSLGGLVCAEVIVLGEKSDTGDSVSKIAKLIKGMVFLGTPFGGSAVAGWGDLVRKIYTVVKDTDQRTLKFLRRDDLELKGLRSSFPEVIRKRIDSKERVSVVFFFEKKKTSGVEVVSQASASYPGVGEILGIRANHSDICKFGSAEDDGYKLVKGKILELIKGETKVQNEEYGVKYELNQYGDSINTAIKMEIQNQTNHFKK
ncbi:Alpha/Beta hydrolase protein [Tricladium varicosporioides]|nr:Alpha/Beta hydrolase protein [Hymenoscyphus varicosporioides]